MTTDGPGVAPFTRFSRIGFGLGLMQHNGSRAHGRDGKKKPSGDEDWYIPYNGPYEAPREVPQRRKERDSWGDPISGEDDEYDDEKPRLSDQELHNRYGGHPDFQRLSRARYGDEAKGRFQGRPQSVVSGHTMSSGNLDPNRTSIGIPRRSTVSAGTRPPVPSYIDTDAAAGVGGSPMPPVAHANEKSTPTRRNFVNMFSLTGQRSPPLDHDRASKTLFKKSTPRLPTNSNSMQSRDVQHPVLLEWPPRRDRTINKSPSIDALNSIITDDEDYYNSYYSTLVQTPKQSTPPFQSSVSSSSQQFSSHHPPGPNPPSSFQHPYATAHPQTQVGDTELPSSSKRGLTFTQPIRKPASADTPHFHLPRPMAQMQQLKNSISTPDLRIASRASSKPPLPIRIGTSYPKGKDRWLSAETWCDALLFPRPRLKVKQDSEASPSIMGSGRIVSPPGTPIVQASFTQQMSQEVMPSRVLAHSRSMMDLSKRNEATGHPQSKQGSPSKHAASRTRPEVNLHTAKDSSSSAHLKPHRPKSFAQDDLALLATPLSLDRVLEEGAQLENQRKQWKAHAVESFGNKQTRNISRARSKSLTQKGKRVQYEQSNIDFLAARACLGDQNIVPVFPTSSQHTKSQHTKSFEGSASGRGSHSHSNSLVKTVSSKTHSHSRGHSRTDSWGKSALKIAKNTVGICGFSGDSVQVDLMEEKLSGLEGALKREGTRVIRLADPAQIPLDRGLGDPRVARSASPSSSGISESRMGIALSTPPPDELYDRESIRLPSHPYAQGGMYTLSLTAQEARDKGTDYAGAHPSTCVGAATDLPSILARNNLPLHVGQHPYAQAVRDSKRVDENAIQHPRQGGAFTPQSKMRAQVSPGVIHEVLQSDNQYSSFMSQKGSQESPTSPYDKLSANDALVYAALSETHRDSGVGTSENHHGQQHDFEWRAIDAKANTPEIIQRIHRLPAQYDMIRPSLTPQKALSNKSYHPSHHTSNHTAASSPLEHAINFLNPHPKGDALTPSPALTSEGSSPNRSPSPLGSPNDLEGFQDLFYKPSPVKQAQFKAKPDESPSQLAHIPWDLGSRGRRTGSGLTSLARQLSEEFEQMALERTSSQYSRSSTSIFQNNSLTRRPTEGSLEFLFEEPLQDSPDQESFNHSREAIMAFKPSVNLPEDVESSRASTPLDDLEDAEDQTARFRVGMVESVSTPPAIFSDERRISFSGQLSSFEHDKAGDESHSPSSRPRTLSGLQPPPPDAARSSYITTSDASRMSGLSDFPSPPRDALTPRHLSLLSSYFDEAHSLSEARDAGAPPLPLDFSDRRYTFGQIPPDASRVTFGDDANAEDLAAALSSSPSSRI